MTKAGGSINIFSESNHIEALIKPCKIMKIKKKSYLYNPNLQPIVSDTEREAKIKTGKHWDICIEKPI